LAAALLAASFARADDPDKGYPFHDDPTRVLSTLTGVPADDVLPQFHSRFELQLLHDAEAGRLQSMSLGEASLLAAGVRDDAGRHNYLQKLDRIEAEARRAIGAARTPAEVGSRLLESLHKGPMSGGYSSGQCNLATLLDTGKFNCVSATVIYNIMARRLGLKVGAHEVPEHIFSVVFDGRRWLDVETTNAHGFAAKPDRSSLEKLRAKSKYPNTSIQSGFRYPVDDLGLVAVEYFCNGTLLGKDDRRPEAVASKLFALAIDPANRNASNSTLREIDGWCKDLMNAKKFGSAAQLAKRYGQELSNPAKAKRLLREVSQRAKTRSGPPKPAAASSEPAEF
jgi:hypothetical protein